MSWPTLHKYLAQGVLSAIDLSFAKSVLKKLRSEREEHAAFLAFLFSLSRQGHLVLDMHSDLFSKTEESLAELVKSGAATFPQEGVVDVSKEGAVPTTWICRCGDCFYLQKNWLYESQIVEHLRRLSHSLPEIPLSFEPAANARQKEAIEKALRYSLTLLAGGPGTGKTFTAAQIVKACLQETQGGFRVLLTAPTGKAVAQLEGNIRRAFPGEIALRTGTLHAILGIRESMPEEDETPSLLADLIIVDECSMIDAKLFARLLASIPEGARLVLIGDKDQLPPIEAGSIFADLLDLGYCPATHLNLSLRSDRAEILTFCALVKEGDADAALHALKTMSDISWRPLEEDLKKSLVPLWEEHKERFPSYFLEKPTYSQLLPYVGGFSLLSCMRQGPLGVDALNRYFLTQYLKEAQIGRWWAAPVIITRNDYDLELFNGDVGFLVREITRDFSLEQLSCEDTLLLADGREIPVLSVNAFEYSYCLSVHKAQGSEYEEISILAPSGSEHFGREVLYTALTRARRRIAIAASEELLRQSIQSSSRKVSGLKGRAILY